MVQTRKSRPIRSKSTKVTQPHWPVWYQSESPMGSAVRYIASLSSKFQWVGIYSLKGSFLELSSYLGKDPERFRIPVDEGIFGRAIAENQDLYCGSETEKDTEVSGLEIQNRWVVLLHNRQKKILGEICIDSYLESELSAEEKQAVRVVAQELGVLWPE